MEKIKKVEAGFLGKYPFQKTNWHFLFEKLAKFQSESSLIAYKVPHSICDDLGSKVLNIESHFPENLRRLSLKLGKN